MPIDDAAVERCCIEVLRGADRGSHTALSPADDRRTATASMVAALGWMYIDVERAVRELEAVVAQRRPDGAIAAAPGHPGAALPLLASMVRRLFHAARARPGTLEARIVALVPAIERHHQSLEGRGARHLCVVAPEDERVAEGDPARTDRRGPAPLLDVAQSALLVQADSDLADVCIHSGRPTRSMIARRTRVAQAIAEQLWRPELALFAAPGEAPRASGLLPLWCGAALAHQARALVRHIDAGGAFWAAHPVATSAPAPAVARRMEPLLDWLLVGGLHRYGFEERARRLRDALLERVQALGCHAAFAADPDVTLDGAATRPSTITAALALDLVRTRLQS
jgi:hypothetical protein